jgi:hypothetical protein
MGWILYSGRKLSVGFKHALQEKGMGCNTEQTPFPGVQKQREEKTVAVRLIKVLLEK